MIPQKTGYDTRLLFIIKKSLQAGRGFGLILWVAGSEEEFGAEMGGGRSLVYLVLLCVILNLSGSGEKF